MHVRPIPPPRAAAAEARDEVALLTAAGVAVTEAPSPNPWRAPPPRAPPLPMLRGATCRCPSAPHACTPLCGACGSFMSDAAAARPCALPASRHWPPVALGVPTPGSHTPRRCHPCCACDWDSGLGTTEVPCRGGSPLWLEMAEAQPQLPRCAEALSDWLHVNGVTFGHCGELKAAA